MKTSPLFRYSLLFFISLFSLSVSAQTEITSYSPGVTADGITYFLPKTQLRIVITAIKRHLIPGEFSGYAQRYLRIDDAIQSEYDSWEIENIKIYPYGVADKTKAYSIKNKIKTSAPLVQMSSDNRLLSINTNVSMTEEDLPLPSVVPLQTKQINGADYKTQEILSAGSTAKMAELTANEIYDIRENRSLLTKGQADFMPKDGEQLKIMLANLDEQEKGLLQLFKGTYTEERHTFVYNLKSDKNIEKLQLLNFSKYLGIVDNDDPAGTPIYVSLTDCNSLPIEDEANKNKKKKEVDDLRYIIPGSATVSVFSENKEYVRQNIAMAQFGRVEHLGGELFNKKYTTRVILSPITGGIVKIEADKPE